MSGGKEKVCCLQKPLKIREPSEMEPESYAVFNKRCSDVKKHLFIEWGESGFV